MIESVLSVIYYRVQHSDACTMSGQGGAFSQPHWRTNRNERSRDRFSRDDGKFSRNRSSSRGKHFPRGLKGKELGLYFRDKKRLAEERKGVVSQVNLKPDENIPLEHQKMLLDESLKGSGVVDAAVSKRNPEDFQEDANHGGHPGKSKIPPGLKGAEIGLYFKNLQGKKNKNKEKQPFQKAASQEVSLDARRESQIYQFLKDIDVKYSRSDSAGPSRSSSSGYRSVTERLEEVVNSKNNSANERMRQLGKISSDKYIPPCARMKREPKWEAEDSYDHRDMEEYDAMDGNDQPNPAAKYKHIGESAFKHKFLRSITGSIQDNLERSLSSRYALSRNHSTDQQLLEELEDKQNSRYYQKMKAFREKLPSYSHRKEIVRVIESNQVCVINGETGCGKTTQVVQFLLDEYITSNRGSVCHIICTQPRRISAISVAERVADERDEKCGRSVGYQIRLERKLPRRSGSILFCTTGVLLQKLQSNPAMTDVSHLILDEIHERDTISDFVLTILKDVIPLRPDLRVVLMSATLDADQFSRYYDNCPSLNIPGFTYPVEEYYLEDIVKLLNFRMNVVNQPKWRRYTKSGKLKMRKTVEFNDLIEPYVRHLRSTGNYPEHVLTTLMNPESEDVNLELIYELICHICHNEPEGAILVFLPGWDKISHMNRMLTDSGKFPSSRYLIIPLHSLMPTSSQKSVFNRPPTGVRKIVLSTSIAETSITIDDIVYVINCGKTKLQNFDVEANISTLKPEWISVANARQRRGRAGRVQPGVCYHTYTRAREQTLMNYALPEMLRTRLEEVILQIKILQLGKVSPFLERVLDPPNSKAVDLSLKLLERMNALDEEESLTPLGFHLAKLPMDPQTGKMILMGAIFSCVDPVFSVAASLSFKDAFLVPLGQEDEVNRKKEEMSGGMKSDHWVIAQAFKRWEEAERHGSGRNFCWNNYLSPSTLLLLRDMKKQFAENLYEMNFLNTPNPKDPAANLNSHNIGLVKAIICAGLYPNVAILRSVSRLRNGMVRVKLITPEDGRVHIHPRSINERQTHFESPFLVYHTKLKSSSINLHDTTMVHPMPLLFFGQHFWIEKEKGDYYTIKISNAIQFRCRSRTTEIIKELRERMVKLLEYKISHPGTIDWSEDAKEGALLRAIIELISYEDSQMQMIAQEGDDYDVSD